MVQSSGTNLCDVWCSSVSKIMSFSLPTFMAEIYKWDSLLSKIKRKVSSLEGLSHVIQGFMQLTKSLTCDQPVGFAPPFEAVGTPVDMWFLKYNLGNTNIAGTWLPMAFTATIIVIFISLSPDTTLPSYFSPLSQKLWEGYEHELPASSNLQILVVI